MFKSFYPLFFLLSLIAFCYSSEIDYGSFNSIEEVIDFETSCILNLSPEDYEHLSDAYASRAESFLLCGYFDTAIDDFKKAYECAEFLKNDDCFKGLAFRSLFGQGFSIWES